MARLIGFAGSFDKIIAKTETRVGIRWANPTDRDAFVVDGMSAYWLEPKKDLQVVLAEQNGQIVGCVAFSTSTRMRQYDWLVLEMREGRDVYSFGGFVKPEGRGQGLLACMRGFAARQFIRQGYQRDLTLVHADNEASIKANLRSEMVPVLTLTRVRIGGLVLVRQGWRVRHVAWKTDRPFVLSM